MRIGIASPFVRLYPVDDQEQNIADRISRFQRRNFRYINGERCLVFRFESEKEALLDAMKAFLGLKRGTFMFERVSEQMCAN